MRRLNKYIYIQDRDKVHQCQSELLLGIARRRAKIQTGALFPQTVGEHAIIPGMHGMISARSCETTNKLWRKNKSSCLCVNEHNLVFTLYTLAYLSLILNTIHFFFYSECVAKYLPGQLVRVRDLEASDPCSLR